MFIIACAPQDRAVAEQLAKYLSDRARLSQIEDGAGPQRFLQPGDVLIALISQNSVFSPHRMRFDARALDAWSEGQLVLAKLDHNFAPLGLRDLPFIDASWDTQRDFAWSKVLAEASEKARPKPPPAPAPGAPDAALEEKEQDRGAQPDLPRKRSRQIGEEPAPKKASASGWPWLGGLLGVGLAALVGVGVFGSLRTSPPVPDPEGDAPYAFLNISLDDVRAWIETPIGRGVLIGGAVLAALLGMLAVASRARARSSARQADRQAAGTAPLYRTAPMMKEAGSPPDASAPAAEAPGAAVPAPLFVSYARADTPSVDPVVARIEDAGKSVWIDRKEIDGGDGWAVEIVRAIKGAGGVVFMCSIKSVESPHVRRELHLADKYKKRMVPVLIEPVELPEEFEYFFAGLQWLEWFKLPEDERRAALSRALADKPAV
jgi:hypothetical protein